MNIHDFSTNASDYGFDVDNKKTAKAIHDLADAIDSGEIAPQSVRITSIAKIDDYPYTSLRILFAEKRKPENSQIKELRGTSQFPVDVVQVGSQTEITDAVGTNGCKATVSTKQ